MRKIWKAVAVLACLTEFASFAQASTVDSEHIVELPDGSKYVKVTVSYAASTPGGDSPMTDSYTAFNLVTCGRGLIWSVSSTSYYRGRVVDVSYAPKAMKLSGISAGSVADEVYKAACRTDN